MNTTCYICNDTIYEFPHKVSAHNITHDVCKKCFDNYELVENEFPKFTIVKKTDYTIVFDGGCRNNQDKNNRQAYGSYKLTTRNGQCAFKTENYGNITNNAAEYSALESALRDLHVRIFNANKSPRSYSLTIIGDSQLVINQIQGKWKVKEGTLLPFVQFVKENTLLFKEVRYILISGAKMKTILGH